jgi:hypothetical protein
MRKGKSRAPTPCLPVLALGSNFHTYKKAKKPSGTAAMKQVLKLSIKLVLRKEKERVEKPGSLQSWLDHWLRDFAGIIRSSSF